MGLLAQLIRYRFFQNQNSTTKLVLEPDPVKSQFSYQEFNINYYQIYIKMQSLSSSEIKDFKCALMIGLHKLNSDQYTE